MATMRQSGAWVLVVAGLVACCWAWSASAQTSAQTSARPNVLLIIADDLGYNEVGFNGDSLIPTPRIDSIAAGGVVFSEAYANAPICAPSRAGLLLGDYPHRFGFEENPNNPSLGLPPDEANLLRSFDDLGYRVGVFGKWHLGSAFGLNTPTDVGADTFFGTLAGIRSYFPGETNVNRQMYRDTTNIEAIWGGEGDPGLYDPVRGRYITDALGEEAGAFVAGAIGAGEPFFAMVSFTAPHAPIEAKSSDLALVPVDYAGPPELAASIIAMDRAVGMVLDAIEAGHAGDDTIVVFVNDNGGAGTGVVDQDNSPLTGSKRTMFEGGIRVPMAIAGPGVAPGTAEGMVSLMDVAPTLVGLAGGTWPGSGEGVDLSAALVGGAVPTREALYWRADNLWAVRAGDAKLLTPDDGRAMALFDLATDLGETSDLLGAAPGEGDALLALLTRWEASVDRIRWKPQTFIVQFDGYRFDTQSGATLWSDTFAWINATGAAGATLTGRESYADTRLVFPLTASGYALTNDLTRATGLAFMLSSMTFEGALAQPPAGGHMFDGLGLVFAPRRDGTPARIEHGATWPQDAGDGPALVRVAMPITVIDALELAGDGSGEVVLEGGIAPLDTPIELVKRGASVYRLVGDAAPAGRLGVEAGVLAVGGDGVSTSVTVGEIAVETGAALAMSGDASIVGDVLALEGALDLTLHAAGTDAPISLEGVFRSSPGALVRLGVPSSLGERRSVVRAGSFDLSPAPVLEGAGGGVLVWTGEVVGDRYDAVATCAADLAVPIGSLDFFDVLAFLALFDAGDPLADLAMPEGALDFFDIVAYLDVFDACWQ